MSGRARNSIARAGSFPNRLDLVGPQIIASGAALPERMRACSGKGGYESGGAAPGRDGRDVFQVREDEPARGSGAARHRIP